jgi:hypothetical protein
MSSRIWRRVALAVVAAGIAVSAAAHHSYAMFDLSRHASVAGTVAKLEWGNPHVFVWLYVANGHGGYDLYAMENGSVSILGRFGWKRDSLRPGDRVRVEYLPLKNGRNGGYFVRATLADGRVLAGDPYGPGGPKSLQPASVAP